MFNNLLTSLVGFGQVPSILLMCLVSMGLDFVFFKTANKHKKNSERELETEISQWSNLLHNRMQIFPLSCFIIFRYRPAESSVCVLEEDARVSLCLQHPVPVELVVGVQGTFKVLKHRNEKSIKSLSLDYRVIKELMWSLKLIYLNYQCTDSHFLCCVLRVVQLLCCCGNNENGWHFIYFMTSFTNM